MDCDAGHFLLHAGRPLLRQVVFIMTGEQRVRPNRAVREANHHGAAADRHGGGRGAYFGFVFLE
jgi:hypothetical protein